MERAFDRDFSQVRLHTDSAAEGMARQFSARAFTSGEHIAFGRGQYQPSSHDGEVLIAHELAHVAQQQDAASGRSAAFGSDRSFEVQAERAASAVARGAPAGLPSPAPALVQRDEEEEAEKKAKGLEEVPAASMTANFYGLTFRSAGRLGTELRDIRGRARSHAAAIKRLVGTAYIPGQFEDEAIAEFGLHGEGGMQPGR